MLVSRRALFRGATRLGAGLALLGAAGCSGDGLLSGEPKKYEGGGPLPEMKGDEVTETPEPGPKGKARAGKR